MELLFDHGACNPKYFPPIDVFQTEDMLFSFNNRRLYVWKVATCLGLFNYMIVNVRSPDDPVLRRRRHDYHTGNEAEKWERHLTSTRDGLTVKVNGGSRYEHLQAPVPCGKLWIVCKMQPIVQVSNGQAHLFKH